jgi:uncharacterized membrane protein
VDPVETIEQYVQRRASVDISGALSRGWALLRDNMGMLVGATVLAWLVSLVPFFGWILSFVLLGGLDYLFLRRMRGETVQIGDVFAGFNLAFLNLVMCGLVKWLLVCLGFLACILPGIYLGIGYVFALPLVIDKKMDFWPAMELSRQVVHKHWWSTFALVIVLSLVAFAGFLVCGVGELITIPLASAAFLYVYEDLFGAPAAAQ